MFVANYAGGSVTIIDATTNTWQKNIDIGFAPHGISITPDGSKIYVTHLIEDTDNPITVLDAEADTILTTITVGDAPYILAISPDGTRAYVPNTYDYTLSILDLTADTVLTTVDVGRVPLGVSVHPDGTKVYVTMVLEDAVFEISTLTNEITDTISVGYEPIAFGNFISSKSTILSTIEIETTHLDIFPNPVSNQLTITLPSASKAVSFSLYNVARKKVKDWKSKVGANSSIINVSDLPAGVYVLSAKGNDWSSSEKIVVE